VVISLYPLRALAPVASLSTGTPYAEKEAQSLEIQLLSDGKFTIGKLKSSLLS
jgi:hypothetical protein